MSSITRSRMPRGVAWRFPHEAGPPAPAAPSAAPVALRVERAEAAGPPLRAQPLRHSRARAAAPARTPRRAWHLVAGRPSTAGPDPEAHRARSGPRAEPANSVRTLGQPARLRRHVRRRPRSFACRARILPASLPDARLARQMASASPSPFLQMRAFRTCRRALGGQNSTWPPRACRACSIWSSAETRGTPLSSRIACALAAPAAARAEGLTSSRCGAM